MKALLLAIVVLCALTTLTVVEARSFERQADGDSAELLEM